MKGSSNYVEIASFADINLTDSSNSTQKSDKKEKNADEWTRDEYEKDPNTCKAHFNVSKISRFSSFINIGKTMFFIIIISISAYFFDKDTKEIVSEPIYKMTKKIQNISDNPIEAILHEDNDNSNGNEKESFFLCFKCNKKKSNSLETTILENTIGKIGALLALGFGEAGSEIIAKNMKSSGEGDIDPMIEGKKVMAVYGFCDIRNFTDTTEELEEDVMIFVNRIGEIVHEITNECCGSANKNIGDAFLLVWKFEEKFVEEVFSNSISKNPAVKTSVMSQTYGYHNATSINKMNSIGVNPPVDLRTKKNSIIVSNFNHTNISQQVHNGYQGNSPSPFESRTNTKTFDPRRQSVKKTMPPNTGALLSQGLKTYTSPRKSVVVNNFHNARKSQLFGIQDMNSVQTHLSVTESQNPQILLNAKARKSFITNLDDKNKKKLQRFSSLEGLRASNLSNKDNNGQQNSSSGNHNALASSSNNLMLKMNTSNNLNNTSLMEVSQLNVSRKPKHSSVSPAKMKQLIERQKTLKKTLVVKKSFNELLGHQAHKASYGVNLVNHGQNKPVYNNISKADISLINCPEVNQIVDLALMAFAKIVINIHKSLVLDEYRHNEKLNKRIENFCVKMGFGLHLGWSIEGAIGSGFKIDASYLSPHVNMAAKLEEGTKEYGVHMILSDDFVAYLSPKARDEVRVIDLLKTHEGHKYMLHTLDLDIDNLPIDKVRDDNEEPMARYMRKRKERKVKLSQILNEGKCNIWEDYEKNDAHYSMVRKKYTKRFYESYKKGLEHYKAGEFKLAKKHLLDAEFEIHGEKNKEELMESNIPEETLKKLIKDGPIRNIIVFMEEKKCIKPIDWDGYRLAEE